MITRAMFMIMLCGAFVSAAPPEPSGTIALATANPTFGQDVTFDWATQNVAPLGHKDGPRIQVLCYQDGALVYGMADRADASFLLGGGSSQWVLNGGGPAHCTADLYFWSYHGSQIFNLLASTEFDAQG